MVSVKKKGKIAMFGFESSTREGEAETLRTGASPSKFSWERICCCQGAGEEKFGDVTPAAMLAASRRAPSYLSSIES